MEIWHFGCTGFLVTFNCVIDMKIIPQILYLLSFDCHNCFSKLNWNNSVPLHTIRSKSVWRNRCTHMCMCTRAAHIPGCVPPPGCLEWKHSQGWRGKPGKHFFRHKHKNMSWACCYCTVLGRCFVCSDNSRTFKWRPETEPETRAHTTGGEERSTGLYSLCVYVCMRLSECVSVRTLTGRHTIIDPHDYRVTGQVGVSIRGVTVCLCGCAQMRRAHMNACRSHGVQCFQFS